MADHPLIFPTCRKIPDLQNHRFEDLAEEEVSHSIRRSRKRLDSLDEAPILRPIRSPHVLLHMSLRILAQTYSLLPPPQPLCKAPVGEICLRVNGDDTVLLFVLDTADADWKTIVVTAACAFKLIDVAEATRRDGE